MLFQPLPATRNEVIRVTVLGLAAVLVALAAFSWGLWDLVARWQRQEEYSHGFFIPLITLWMLWARRDAVVKSIGNPSWFGPILILLAVLMLVIGELSALFVLPQIGFVVALMGIVLGIGGMSLLRVSFIPLAFLVFAIPLPVFVDSQLSWQLQLISSELGVFVIRLFDIPVYLTGNVIDLGHYKLQVAEACSGLRYLFPLLSLGFLAAYFFHAPLWQRIFVFLSTIPITIAMNSFRIGMIGVTVDRWGIEMADGFLHFFEGWIIFLACSALLAIEIYLLAWLTAGKGFSQVFHFPEVSPVPPQTLRSSARWVPITASLALLLVAAPIGFYVANRSENVPPRLNFVAFPGALGDWKGGRPTLLEPEVERVLAAADYLLSDYTDGKGAVVNLHVAYYASQRKGAAPHMPTVCIPGGGWQIVNLQRTQYSSDALEVTLPLNRVIIARDSDRQLVYYWFVQRGRKVANEYLSKWYLFADAILKNRTDGALVRLTTPMRAGETEQEADRRLQSFINELEPRLKAYLPSAFPAGVAAVAHAKAPFEQQ